MTFTSDFGRDDEFVGVCHGVIARIAPHVRIIDLAHGVAGVRAGAVALVQSVGYLPSGSVHLAVVDPGVGSERRGVVIEASEGMLVGPDNGLLCDAADELGGVQDVFELADPTYRLESVSSTFHGRDVFAPAAAHLASGVPPSAFGPHIADLVRLPAPRVEAAEGALTADVLRADRFGNLQLAARAKDLTAAGFARGDRVEIEGAQARVVRTFSELPPGGLGVLVDSSGYVAVVANGADASAILRGPERVTLRP